MVNLKKQKKYGTLLVVILFFASLIVFNNNTTSALQNAELTIIDSYIFKGEENTVIALADENSISVENSAEYSQVLLNNNLVNKIEYGYIERITNFKNDDDAYLLIEYRYHGSGSILFFNIVKVSEESGEVIYQSEETPRGKIVILDSSLELATPKYDDEDSLASPSNVTLQQIEVNGETVQETDSTIMSVLEFDQKYETEPKQFQILSEPGFQNPDAAEINRVLTEKALANNVPPELLKAISWQESKWRQFDSGEPLIGFDGRGIGIMQVTPGVTGIPEIDGDLNNSVERLKTDIEYNIEMGIRIFLNKWNWTSWIPTINDRSWEVIDNWYFATIAYNGISAINDPNLTIEPGYPPFQSHIYNHLRTKGLLSIADFPKEELDIFYNDPVPTKRSVMRFSNKMQYDLFGPMFKTKHKFNEGDQVKTTSRLILRSSPGGSSLYTIPKGQIISITGIFEYQNNQNNHFVWYPVKVRDGNIERTGYVASSYLVNVEELIYGQTRQDTAVLISQQGWSEADTVVLARGDDFPDALSGAPLAHMLNAPMLLTRTDKLQSITRQEIQRLNAQKVVILGGHLAISSQVEEELTEMGLEIERISGNTRFDTARRIADKLGSEHPEVIVINVDAFADAMAIAPYAARNRVPILLTSKDSVPNVTREVLNNAERTILIGGELVISNSIANTMPNVRRFDGRTRYDTSAQIVRELNSSKNNAYLVSGLDFPDGLTGAVLAAANQGDSIILTDKNSLPNATRDLINEFSSVTILGGPLAISEEVVIEVKNR